jgi:uncharacterized protein YidB (DUF937 family)
MTYPCPSVVTMATLDTQQLQFLIDLMWGHDPKDTQRLAQQHGVDETDLLCQLSKCLNDALAEIF